MVAFSVNYWHATASRLQQTPQKQSALPSSETAAKNAVQPQLEPGTTAAKPKFNTENAGALVADKATLIWQTNPNLTFQQLKAIMQSDAPATPNRSGPAGQRHQPAQDLLPSALNRLNALG